MTARDELAAMDRAHVLHPHSTVGASPEPLIIDRGQGALIWDIDGTEYVDGTCGLWQCAVGHGREEHAAAAATQIRELEFYPSFWDLSNEPAIRLAARLASIAPEGLDRIFYTNGGSEGTETAIKLVRLAWHATPQLELAIVGQNLVEARHREFGSSFTGTAPSEIPRSVYGKITWRF